jgi:hypothetical protein
MVLFPLQAYERNPVGLLPLKANVAVEGGMVGQVVATGLLPEVDLFSDSGAGTALLPLVGLVDDSTSGAGYGAGQGYLGVPIAFNVTSETGVPVGPATHLASGKCTMWTDSGLYVTDTFDPAINLAALVPGVALYAGTGATAGLLARTGTDVLGAFVRRFVGGMTVDARDSWFVPRVQPLPAGREFMVLKFK